MFNNDPQSNEIFTSDTLYIISRNDAPFTLNIRINYRVNLTSTTNVLRFLRRTANKGSKKASARSIIKVIILRPI